MLQTIISDYQQINIYTLIRLPCLMFWEMENRFYFRAKSKNVSDYKQEQTQPLDRGDFHRKKRYTLSDIPLLLS